MRQKLRLTCAAAAFAVAFLVVAGAPVLLAQRTASQGVVTPDDPIWGAQDPPEPQPQEPSPAAEPAAQDAAAGRGRAGGAAAGPRPYAQVITSEARTDE